MFKKIVYVTVLFIVWGLVIMVSNNNIPSEEVVIDTRAERIDKYFSERSMPLAGYGKKMVEEADKNNLDWSLLAAISVRESSGGKFMCTNNPFGWGSCDITFSSINEAIEIVSFKLNSLSYYKDKTTKEKLYYYNGTVIPTYPDEVLLIMQRIENGI